MLIKKYFILLVFTVALSACQKEVYDFDPTQQPSTIQPGLTGSFTAVVDGVLVNFTVIAATLTHYSITNEKRMDIAAISYDNKRKIILTIGEKGSQINEITKKKYTLDAFPIDDPSTQNFDESKYSQGYTTYGISDGVVWNFDSYDEEGSFTVLSCDPSKALINGLFETTLTPQSGIGSIIKITSGKITDVKYRFITR